MRRERNRKLFHWEGAFAIPFCLSILFVLEEWIGLELDYWIGFGLGFWQWIELDAGMDE